DAEAVARRLEARYPDMAVFTSRQLARRTQAYWLAKTRAGLVLAFSATLGLLVGAVITSQTFYSATAAAWRELAVLRALGLPRRRMPGWLLAEALRAGRAGPAVGLPVPFALGWAGERWGVQPVLPAWLIAGVAALIVGTAGLAGLLALRSLRLVE